MQETSTPSRIPHIGLSHGDLNGIGYEIILKAFSDARMLESLTPVLYGQSKAFSYYKKNLGLDSPNYFLVRDASLAADGKFNILNIFEDEVKIEPGAPSNVSAQMSALAMKKAVQDLQGQRIEALVMAPDCKPVAKTNRDFLFSFHPDADTLRVMVSGKMRIGLATDDLPLNEALPLIDIRYLVSKLTVFSEALKTDFGIHAPKIAVMGINPHCNHEAAGDDDKVLKAVCDAQKKGIFAFGPFSPVQLFVSGLWQKYDAVLAMYYDQGVFPLKYAALDGCAYYWAGLPVVCAAPLHGPVFEMANANKADPDAFRKAVFLAADIVSQRKGE